MTCLPAEVPFPAEAPFSSEVPFLAEVPVSGARLSGRVVSGPWDAWRDGQEDC